mmetsp:Transcript_109699/g.327920  ORF Transcript_109699/g.327920 Transcript_109699/m.327920 type:complete len:98 (-) Transcript_109699:106-399(-)
MSLSDAGSFAEDVRALPEAAVADPTADAEALPATAAACAESCRRKCAAAGSGGAAVGLARCVAARRAAEAADGRCWQRPPCWGSRWPPPLGAQATKQ